MTDPVESAYGLAAERYAALGVDTETSLRTLATTPVSLNCWQGDDVRGFENLGSELGSGLAVTGGYPGRARNGDELRTDLDCAFRLIPGAGRLNLQAIYAEAGGQAVPRSELGPEHFARWVDWAKETHHGLDFNPSCFGHPLAASGMTLAHPDPTIRDFWIAHCLASRQIGAHFGQELGTACITNIWIPDGSKDNPVDRRGPRERLRTALDEVFATPLNPVHSRDALEGKLFGIGLESYTVGSHEFYYGYAVAHQKVICIDTGHFHPTEVIADKLSSLLTFIPEVYLHISRGVRWDSDHVVTLTDDVEAIMQEIVRGGYLDRAHIGLDFFDASINRVAAWVIGARAVQRALLMALLEPIDQLRGLEEAGDTTGRLALLEELKGLPLGAVWDYHCQSQGVPVGYAFMDSIRVYERDVLSERG